MSKKTIFLLAAVLTLGFVSCKRCHTCTNCDYSYDDGEYCKATYQTWQSYNAQIKSLEDNGCSCD